MKIVLTESQLKYIIESEKNGVIHCDGCGWEWKKSEGGKDPYTCHKCGHDNEKLNEDDGERKDVYSSLTDKQIKSIDDLNKDAKFLKCKECRKLYTQTTHKKKKSPPICPWCGKHN
jgi:Zn finger protein HypA/HybF involved in hydrogenase expression